MAFNPRMSMAAPSQQQQQQSRSRKKEDEADAFMRLPDKEIVGCISDIGIAFTVADLQKPNPAQVQQIFEWFAELLLNATRETVEPAMRAAAEEVCGEYSDCMPPDARNLMGFYVSLRRLLLECGIADFSFADLHRPTYDRLVKIFSYIINFVRFRESQTAIIDEHFNRAEAAKARIEALYTENREGEERLAGLRRHQRAMRAAVQEKTGRNEELKRQLLELQRSQERAALRLEDAKTGKNELQAALQDRAGQRLALKQECAKLRPYAQQSAGALQAALADLTAALAADRARIEALDRRARALGTSVASFEAATAMVAACVGLLDEIAAELGHEHEQTTRRNRQQDQLSHHGNSVRQVEREEVMLQTHLRKWAERTDKLREQSRLKADEATEKMVKLRELHHALKEEHANKGREMERRRVRIEQTEKKMLDLKENIVREVHSAHDEYLKLEAHVKLYIDEMEQSIPQV